MSFANLLSNADLASRRSEAARLLQVSIDNEVYLEGKMKKFQDPRKIDEVPPVYQTYSELVANSIQQEQLAIKNLSELKIPYDLGSQIAQYLNSIGNIVLFNASFPTIKADIMKKYNVKLLDVDFLKNYLNRFFSHLESSYGFTIDRETSRGANAFSSVAEAKAIIPTTDGVKGGDRGVLSTLFDLVQTAIRITGEGAGSQLPELIRRVIEVMPTQADLTLLNNANQITKRQLLTLLSRAFVNTKCPTSADIIKMNNTLLKATQPSQMLVGIDEQSQMGRDVYSATTGATLNAIELQFRGCSDQNLAVLGGVREQIRQGEAVGSMEEFGRLAGEAGNMSLQVQEIAREVLGDAIGEIEQFDREENEIVRRQSYEEDLADDVPDDVLAQLARLLPKYAVDLDRLEPPDVSFYFTEEGLNEIITRGFFVVNADDGENIDTINFNVGLIRTARSINQLINRTGRSFAELIELSGGRSRQLEELQAAQDIWVEDGAVRAYRGGDFNPLGRELLDGDDVGGMPEEASGGGGGAARPSRRQQERADDIPDYVYRGRDNAGTLVMPEDEFAKKYPKLFATSSDQALTMLSSYVGGLDTQNMVRMFPYQMTALLREKLAEFEAVEADVRAEESRPQRKLSAKELAEQDAFQKQQDAEARGRQDASRDADKRLEDTAFLEARMARTNLYQADLDNLVRKALNPLLKRNGMPEIEINRNERREGKMVVIKIKVAELRRQIIGAIIALDRAGVPTILRDRQTNMLGSITKGERAGMEYGLGVKRRIGGRISQLPPMNPYDKKKFLETAEGREFMNLHPREKIMDRKFIDEHRDEEEGMGLYNMTRIPVRKGKVVKKKIGGGIAVEASPTYAEFGKYAVHLPQLHNKNTLNIKYKSLGAIPTLKPITISDDFKDFILETLEKKSVNERALKKLPSHEISYFERAVSGAGLLETFKMKRTNTDEEKKDLDRFTLLRGELIAGNNSDKLVKELRSLIVKFLNTGRIHKAEGMNLLQELSVL
jgi:hypothetical protein